MDEKSLARTGVPDRNLQLRTFFDQCLQMGLLEGRNRLLNTVLFGTYGIGGRLRKVIFSQSRSLRPSGAAFARLIICRLRRSLGVNTISFLKEESGGSLKNR